MLNPFSKPAKVGSELIRESVAEFEAIAKRIEAGVAHNRAAYDANKQQIDALHAHNTSLETDACMGERVAAKLRSLIS